MMRVDLIDHYGWQVEMLSERALRLVRESEALIGQWEAAGSIPCGFARHIAEQCQPKNAALAAVLAEFSMAWLFSGLPRIIVDHKLAASLAATAIPEEFCNTIRPPWKHFQIMVPQGLLFNPVPSTVACFAAKVSGVDGSPAHSGLRAYAQAWHSPECRERTGHSISAITAVSPWSEFAKPPLVHLERCMPDAELARSTMTHMQLIFGCLAELQGREIQGQLKERQDAMLDAIFFRGKGKLPTTWNLRLSRPVQVDVRKHIKSYVSGSTAGRGKKLSVQFVVRGHWKNQRCGTDGKDRRFIHIEPYWRGPEDAPIAVRPHIIK